MLPGCVFQGWWTKLDGTGEEVTADTRVPTKEAQAYYAKWDINAVYGTSGLEWRLGGDGYAFPQSKTVKDRPFALRTGAVGHSQSSWIETTVTGPCTVVWWWNVSCEPFYDFFVCTVNGAEQARISGYVPANVPYQDIGWQRERVTLAAGEHTLRWTYAKDYSDSFGVDSAWLGDVKVFHDDDLTDTDTPVPYDWLEAFFPNDGDDYGAIANRPGANGIPVWQSYVAGLDPTDALSKFLITNFVVNAESRVTALDWTPRRGDRDYTVYGKTNLTDTTPWFTPTNSGTRFFKVEVKMKMQ